MREAIGGTWLLGLVLTFIVFFASFLAISINYAKAFNVKNSIVDLISKYEGNNCESREHIKSYLERVGYMVSSKCDADYLAYDLNGNYQSSDKGYYCIKKTTVTSSTSIEKTFYGVEVFFRLDVPMLGNLLTFKIRGETEPIYFGTEADGKTGTSCP